MKIGLVVAMESEYRSVLDTLGGNAEGRFLDTDVHVSLRQCGIGKVNAAVGAVKLIESAKPDLVISTGLAGGVGEVDVWDAVVASETAYHDVFCGMGNEYGQVQGLPVRFASDAAVVDKAMSIHLDDGTKFHKGLICTGDQFITRPEPLDAIRDHFPDVLACDMESAAIAHVCHLAKVPFVSIRIISDTPGRTSDHALQWEQSLAHMSSSSFRIIDHLFRLL